MKKIIIGLSVLLFITITYAIYTALVNPVDYSDFQNKFAIWISVPTIIGVFILFILIMGLYTFFMKKYARKNKYLTTIIFIGAIAISCFITRFIIIVNSDYGSSGNPLRHVGNALSAIYGTMGGMALEGAEGGIENTALAVAYYASTLLSGMVFLGIASFNLAYELYSKMKLGLIRDLPGCNRDVYLFTALTNDTLDLAKSIVRKAAKESAAKEKDKEKEKKEISRKPFIIFTGYTLESFDKKNELCKEVLAEGFYYCPCLKKTGNSLFLVNGFRPKKNRRLCLFSFAIDEKEFPIESENASLIFDDIEGLLKHTDNCSQAVEYYLLTKNEINYQAYQSKLDSINEKKKEEKEQKGKKGKTSGHFFFPELYIINEAELTSRQIVQKIMKYDEGNRCFPYASYLFPYGQGSYRVLIAGFGGKGQAVLDELYSQTCWGEYGGIKDKNSPRKNDNIINLKYVPNAFEVSVFDKVLLEDLMGTFSLEHPYYSINNHNNEKEYDGLSVCYNDLFGGFPKDENLSDVSLPIITYYNTSCESFKFKKTIDEITGHNLKRDIEVESNQGNTILNDNSKPKSCGYSKNKRPNMFVFTLGNDITNIRLANSLIADIRQEKCQLLAKYKREVNDYIELLITNGFIEIDDKECFNFESAKERLFNRKNEIEKGKNSEGKNNLQIICSFEKYGFTFIEDYLSEDEKIEKIFNYKDNKGSKEVLKIKYNSKYKKTNEEIDKKNLEKCIEKIIINEKIKAFNGFGFSIEKENELVYKEKAIINFLGSQKNTSKYKVKYTPEIDKNNRKNDLIKKIYEIIIDNKANDVKLADYHFILCNNNQNLQTDFNKWVEKEKHDFLNKNTSILPQTIVICVRNKVNNLLVDVNGCEKEKYDSFLDKGICEITDLKLLIVVVGNSEDIYDERIICNECVEKKYNKIYEIMYNEINDYKSINSINDFLSYKTHIGKEGSEPKIKTEEGKIISDNVISFFKSLLDAIHLFEEIYYNEKVEVIKAIDSLKRAIKRNENPDKNEIEVLIEIAKYYDVDKQDDYQFFLDKLKKYQNIIDEDWNRICLFDRLSNKEALQFQNAFAYYIKTHKKNISDLTADDIRLLATIEHDRWFRLYVSAGWLYYGIEKNKKTRLHDCLCPIELVPSGKEIFDIICFVFACDFIKLGEKNDSKKQETN